MYERTGLLKFTGKAEEYDIFGAKTLFRRISGAVVEDTVKSLKWFSFCTRIDERQVDIMSYKNSKGVKLGSFISEIYPDSSYRSAIYKYLLRDYLCYYEAPTITKDFNAGYGFKSSYNKCLVTSSIHVVAEWLGITVEEAKAQYGSRLGEVMEDNGCDMFQYVKLYETKEHVRKVTKPRSDLDLGKSGTRIIPLYALKTGLDILFDLCSKDSYDVIFCKDSGQERTINITFNPNIIRDIYGDGSYFRDGFDGQYKGDFLSNPSMERGYIRVFELGASKYDSPLRSINYARIISLSKAAPDLTYINIDLESVLSSFIDGINSIKIDVQEFVSMLDVFNVGSERKIASKNLVTVKDLEDWAECQYTLLSTVFLRQLALFMIGNPQWFNDYTGAPKQSYSSTQDDVSIDEDFDLDIG